MPRRLTIFSRMGGKFRLRRKIVDMFPPRYSTYIEPFVGSGQVFLEVPKRPHVRYVLNDKNKDIYHIWKDLQKVSAEDIRHYDFTGNKGLFDRLKQSHPTTPRERLFRNLYLSYYSFSGLRNAYTPKPLKKGANLIKHADWFKKKLRGVKIYNQDYKKVIEKWDNKDAIIYLDPPYTKMERYYEGQAIDPFELAEVCRKIQGKFILSYDISPQVREAFRGFYFHRVRVPYTSGLGGKAKHEYLITNYDPRNKNGPL
jgi:DNA adenine methylase